MSQPTETPLVLRDRDARGVIHLTLNRPHKRNALSNASRSAAVAYAPPAALPATPCMSMLSLNAPSPERVRRVYPRATRSGDASDLRNAASFIPALANTFAEM